MAREVQEEGDICIPMADLCWCWQETTKFCKAIILQFKKERKKKIGLRIKARKILIWNIKGRGKRGFFMVIWQNIFCQQSTYGLSFPNAHPSLPGFEILKGDHANIALLPVSVMSCLPSRYNWGDTVGGRGVSSWFPRAFLALLQQHLMSDTAPEFQWHCACPRSPTSTLAGFPAKVPHWMTSQKVSLVP